MLCCGQEENRAATGYIQKADLLLLTTYLNHCMLTIWCLVTYLVLHNHLVKVWTTILVTRLANWTTILNISGPSILWKNQHLCMLRTPAQVSSDAVALHNRDASTWIFFVVSSLFLQIHAPSDDKFSVRKGSLSHILIRHSDENEFCKLELFHFAKLFKHYNWLILPFLDGVSFSRLPATINLWNRNRVEALAISSKPQSSSFS